MSFPDKEKIETLKENGNPELLAELDSQGLLIAPGETAAGYADRLLAEEERIGKLREKLAAEKEIDPYTGLTIEAGMEIPDAILEEAAETTRKAYGFAVKWVPGFFPKHGLGILWGGCSISSYEDLPTLFIIRRSFRDRKKFFIYGREELTAHELCHVARTPIQDHEYEEHFAYAISHSPLRRYTGNCFKSEKDAILFILPVFLLLLVQIGRVTYWPMIPAWPFWILAFVWPVFLTVCNIFARRRYFRAENALRSLGVEMPQAVLFRCTADEINTFASLADTPEQLKKYFQEKQECDLRWKVITKRFIRKEEK